MAAIVKKYIDAYYYGSHSVWNSGFFFILLRQGTIFHENGLETMHVTWVHVAVLVLVTLETTKGEELYGATQR
jgi:hypothetical protein